jgi:hypothetical protein
VLTLLLFLVHLVRIDRIHIPIKIVETIETVTDTLTETEIVTELEITTQLDTMINVNIETFRVHPNLTVPVLDLLLLSSIPQRQLWFQV